MYLWLSGNPVTNPLWILGVRTAADAASCWAQITTGGLVRVFNAAQSTNNIGSVAVSTGQWIRLEFRVVSDLTNGVIEWKLFNTADSTTPSENVTWSTQVFGSDTGGARLNIATTPVPAAPFSLWMDDIAASTTGWLGASAPLITNTVLPTVTGNLSVGSTLTANPGTWVPTPSSFNYYWHRADDAASTNLVEIGATGSTYTLAAADVGKFIHAGVVPTP